MLSKGECLGVALSEPNCLSGLLQQSLNALHSSGQNLTLLTLEGLFWSFSQVAKTGIYSGIFSSLSLIAGFGGGEGKSEMICLNHITTPHHWDFPSHPNTLNIFAHLALALFSQDNKQRRKQTWQLLLLQKYTRPLMSHFFPPPKT